MNIAFEHTWEILLTMFFFIVRESMFCHKHVQCCLMECITFATLATEYFCFALFQTGPMKLPGAHVFISKFQIEVSLWDRMGCGEIGSMKPLMQGIFVHSTIIKKHKLIHSCWVK